MSEDYDAGSIQVLEGLEAVRKRPGMYLGDPHDGSALHHCIWEVVDNSVDEHLAGFNDTVEVVLHPDHSLSVRDYGRGIPVDQHDEFGISAAEVIMTKLHAGGKFDNSSYKVSGGLHGVGVSAVNAVSEWMEVVIHRDGTVYKQRFEAGVRVSDLESVGTCDDTGTTITFKPDLSIFTNIIEFDFDQIDSRLKETSFLNAGLRIVITDERGDEAHQVEHHYEGEFLNSSSNSMHAGKRSTPTPSSSLVKKRLRKVLSPLNSHFSGPMPSAKASSATPTSFATRMAGRTCPVYEVP